MGGVDLSDQLIGYHRLLRQTKKYWKTLLYHLLKIAITNAFDLHKWQLMMIGARIQTESQFRDKVVLSIIRLYTPAPEPLFNPPEYREDKKSERSVDCRIIYSLHACFLVFVRIERRNIAATIQCTHGVAIFPNYYFLSVFRNSVFRYSVF